MYNKMIKIRMAEGSVHTYKDCAEVGETINSARWLYERQPKGFLIKGEDGEIFYPWYNILYIEIERYEDE